MNNLIDDNRLLLIDKIIKNQNKKDNILIKGENTTSLNILNDFYYKKIDFIYIDPPYNTGKNFTYKDRNNNWIEFMKERLILSKDLLSDIGFIFVSIDENEYAYLKVLCDEIFKRENYVTTFCWVATSTDLNNIDNDFKISTLGSNSGMFKNGYEYVLCYKSSNKSKFNLLKSNDEYIDSRITNKTNKISQLHIPKGIKCESPITKTFTNIIGGKSEPIKILNTEGMIIKNGILQNDILLESCFRNPNIIKQFFDGKEIIDNKGQKFIEVYLKNSGVPYTRKEKKGEIPTNILSGYGDTSKWTRDLSDILGITEYIFDYPKPYPMIMDLLKIASKEDSIILDFFAGSGTTGQAVMELNNEDKGTRQFILCTNNENNICDGITYPRLYNIINGYIDKKGKSINGIKNNLIYFELKLDFI